MSTPWQARWDSLFAGCFESAADAAAWRPLQPPEADGNPVLVRAHEGLGRAVRVLLRLNDEGRPPYPAGGPASHETHFLPFDAWLETLYDTTGARAYEGLTVSADLSAESLAMARHLIVMHCAQAGPAEEVQAWIDAYYAELDRRS